MRAAVYDAHVNCQHEILIWMENFNSIFTNTALLFDESGEKIL